MDLFNPKTGQVETDLDDTKLAGFIGQGYRPPAFTDESGTQRVRLTVAGERYNIPVAEMSSFLQDMPEARLTNWADDLAASGPLIPGAEGAATGASLALGPLAGGPVANLITRGPGSVMAQAAGQLSGVTLGLSDVALAAVAPELSRALNEQHGGARIGGEIQAIAGSIAASSGTTAPKLLQSVKALAGAPKAAAPVVQAAPKALRALPTVGLTQLSEHVGTRLVGELVKRTPQMGVVTGALAQIGVRGATFAGLGATEGALWGITQGLEEHYMGDPQELGDLLAASVGGGALLGGVAGGAIGAAGGLLSATVGQTAQRTARKLEAAVGTGQAVKMARGVAIEDLASQIGLKDRDLQRLHRKGEYISALFDDTVLPDGAILQKAGPDGAPALVSPGEAVARLQQAKSQWGEAIGAYYTAMDDLAERALPEAALGTKVKEITDALKSGAPENAAALRRELKYMLDTSPWVASDDLAERILSKADELAELPAADAARKTLAQNFDRIQKRPYWSYRDLKREREALRAAFEPILSNRQAALDETSKAAGMRAVWDAIDESIWGKVDQYFYEGADEWRKANDVYKSVVELAGITKDLVNKGTTLKDISRLYGHFSSIAGYRSGIVMTAAMTGAGRQLVSGGLGAGAGAVAGGVLGGPIGAIGGAAAGVGASAGLRALTRSKIPAFRISEVAWKVAQNRELLKAAKTLRQQIDDAVVQFAAKSRLRTATSVISGKAALSAMGLDKDPRRAAVNVRRRTARLVYNPEAFGQFLRQEAGPLQAVHPQMGASYAQALQRQVLATQAALSSMAGSPAATLQPALRMGFEEATTRDLEHLGLKLAAIYRPGAVVREIMDGTATPDQIELLRSVHPRIFAALLQTVARHMATKRDPLTQHQSQILARLGLQNEQNPPGFSARAQQRYQQLKAGVPQGGSQPGQNVLGSLQKVPDAYGTRETRRAREDSAAT